MMDDQFSKKILEDLLRSPMSVFNAPNAVTTTDTRRGDTLTIEDFEKAYQSIKEAEQKHRLPPVADTWIVLHPQLEYLIRQELKDPTGLFPHFPNDPDKLYDYRVWRSPAEDQTKLKMVPEKMMGWYLHHLSEDDHQRWQDYLARLAARRAEIEAQLEQWQEQNPDE